VSIYAQVEDIEAGWDRQFTVPEVERVQVLLDRAERHVRLHISIELRIVLGMTTAENVKDALVGMVHRVLRNPGGYRQQATGPFSATLDRSVASGRISISTTERKLLGMITGAGSMPAGDPALDASVLLTNPRTDEWPP
jgi:hypothetical protein